MRRKSRRRFAYFATLSLSVLAGLFMGRARADGDVLGLYVGAAAGQSQVEAYAPSLGEFAQNHSAYKLIVGLRPISAFGAEVSYVDFGHPNGNIDSAPSDVSQSGIDAFGMVYLPVPVVDVFVKAGLARLQSALNSNNPGFGTCPIINPDCALFHVNRSDTSFAAGAGAQVKFGSLALRAEFERFDAAGANPTLVSLGLTWTLR
jgi:hypothetical protein